MSAGESGDHPLTDIVNFNLEVYNPICDELIRQMSKLVSMNQLYEMFDNFSFTQNQLKNFEILLREKLEKLKVDALNNGWEVNYINLL